MKFKGRFRGLFLDLDKYKAKLEASLERDLHTALEIWLDVVTNAVPVWSGMAQGSLLRLTKAGDAKIFIGPLKAKSRIPKGEALGTGEFIVALPEFRFKFSTSVPHYVQGETEEGVGKSSPWQSLPAGAEAFRAFAKTIRLPRPVIRGRIIKRVN